VSQRLEGKPNGAYQLLIPADDVNALFHAMNMTINVPKDLLNARKEVSREN
jgi:hypothetical protein